MTMHVIEIEMPDLVANAFIESLRLDQGCKFLPYRVIEGYGVAVMKALRKQGIKSRLMLSRQYTDEFYRRYPDYFIQGNGGVKLADGVNSSELIKKFCGALSIDLLQAFRNEESISELIILLAHTGY